MKETADNKTNIDFEIEKQVENLCGLYFIN